MPSVVVTSPARSAVNSHIPDGMPNRALTVSRLIAASSIRAWLRQTTSRGYARPDQRDDRRRAADAVAPLVSADAWASFDDRASAMLRS
jgi:hypothetical protein